MILRKNAHEDRVWFLYMHICPNGKRYIGITSRNPKIRWGNNGKGYYKSLFYNAIKKYGWNNIEHIIVHSELTEQEANSKEKFYIKYYNTIKPNGYNICLGGTINSGYTLSDETRKKISDSRIGKYFGKENPFYGRHHTEATKEKLRKTCVHIGKDNGSSIPIVKVPLDRYEILATYESIHLAEIDMGTSGCIYDCVRHKQKTCRGFRWFYFEEYNNIINNKTVLEKKENKNLKKVIKIDKTNNVVIKIYNSINEANKELGLGEYNSGIRLCCTNKRNTSHKYKWKYLCDFPNAKDGETLMIK